MKNKLYATLIIKSLTLGTLLGSTVLVQESFLYPDGDLDGQNGGVGFTTAWSVTTINGNGLLTSVNNGALFSEPDGLEGGNVDNDSIADRSFTAIGSDAFEISLEYNLISYTEGLYGFNFVLFDSNGVEVFTAGIINDNYQIVFANGEFVSQNVNATPFSDTLTLSLDFSDSSSSTLNVGSTAFTTLDDSALTSNTGFDFSASGTIQVQSSLIDQNQISIDNILITTVPEPSSFLMVSCAVLIPIFRRKRLS